MNVAMEHRDINAAKNIAVWGKQELGVVVESGVECAKVPLDVVFDILASDCQISSTQMKGEAACFSWRYFTNNAITSRTL